MLDVMLYLLYAVAGTSSAALAKAGIGRGRRGEWFAAGWRLVTAIVALGLNFTAVILLLARWDLSVVEPIGVGANLAVSAALAVVIFRERVDAWKAAGFALIAGGVLCVSGPWS